MRSMLVLLGLFALASSAPAALEVTVSPQTIHVGDPVRIDLEIELPATAQAEFPEWGEQWGEAEIREVGEIRSSVTTEGNKAVAQTITIAFFRAGEILLPPPSISLLVDPPNEEGAGGKPATATEPIRVTVESLLPPGEELPEPKPAAAPLSLPWGRPFAWTTTVLALLSLVALAIVLRRRVESRRARREAPDPLAALGMALEELRSRSDLEEVFAGLSLHLRRFLGSTLAFPAAESTTTEMRARLRGYDLPLALTRRTEELLRRCDAVKFARFPAAPEDAEHGLGEAAAIGAATIEVLAPPPTEDAEGQP